MVKPTTFLLYVLLALPATLFASNWNVYNSSTHSGFTNNNVTSVAEVSATGDVWVGSGGGLALYDKSADSWSFFNLNNSGLPSNFILSLAVDAAGDLWAGTASDGLVHYDGTNWTTYTISNSGLPYNVVRDIAFDQSGVMYVATSLGLGVYDGNSWSSYGTVDGLPSPAVNAVVVDGNNVPWIGMEPSGNFPGGLTKLENGVFTKYFTANGLVSNWITDLALDGQGNIWAATRGGLCSFDRNATFTSYTTSNSDLPNNELTGVAAGASGAVWVGTQSSGAVVFDGQSTWTRYTTGNSDLPNNNIQAVFVDAGANTWFGTQQGGAARYGTTALSLSPTLNQEGIRISMANPAAPTGKIRISTDSQAEISMVLYDLTGRIASPRQTVLLSQGDTELDYSWTGLPRGYYLLTLQTRRSLETKRILLTP